MQFTEQQREKMNAAYCKVMKDGESMTMNEIYDTLLSAAAPQVVADERREWVSNGKEWVKVEKNEFFHGVVVPANTLISAPMIGKEREAFDKLVAEYPVKSRQDAEDFFLFGIQHQKMAAPVQAQEPVAYIWSVNGMVKTGGDPAFVDHEKFYSAPVQPVAVPDGIRGPLTEAQKQEARSLYFNLQHLGRDAAETFIRHVSTAAYVNGHKDAAPAAQGGKQGMVQVILEIEAKYDLDGDSLGNHDRYDGYHEGFNDALKMAAAIAAKAAS